MYGNQTRIGRLDTIIPVLVIGAAQAGLAAAYRLQQSGIDFRIVEGAGRIGDSWRKRYASLTLFTPRRFSALPGLGLDGDPEGYATRDEFADYLERYADFHRLAVSTGTGVEKLSRRADGMFSALLTTGETVLAGSVIVSTGGFQRAVVPSVAAGLDEGVNQLTSETYREPSSVAPGTVLVVGDGASGRDIAAELAASHRVLLATGKPRRLFPERILGRSIWWWLSRTGLMNAGRESFIGSRMRRADPFPDRDRSFASLERRGVTIVPRLDQTAGRQVQFVGGRTETIDAVVWAVGFRDEAAWIAVPGAVDRGGRFIERDGVSPVPGLYFVGRPWQRNRASGLIMGVSDDADVIVEAIAGGRHPAEARVPRENAPVTLACVQSGGKA